MKKLFYSLFFLQCCIIINGCHTSDPEIDPSGPFPAEDNFNLVFNLYQGSSGSKMADHLILQVKPYLRDNDSITVFTGNGFDDESEKDTALTPPGPTNTFSIQKVNTSEVNSRLALLKTGLATIDIHYVVYTAGIEHIRQVIDGLNSASKAQLSGIAYGYEPYYLYEFEFDFNKTLTHITDASLLIRQEGFLAGSGPAGRFLRDNELKNYKWNYGEIAQLLDETIIQTQTILRQDFQAGNLDLPEYRRILKRLKDQLEQYPNTCKVYPQITINDGQAATGGNVNAAPLEYCIEAIKVIKEFGFPGASIWYGGTEAVMANMLNLVKAARDHD